MKRRKAKEIRPTAIIGSYREIEKEVIAYNEATLWSLRWEIMFNHMAWLVFILDTLVVTFVKTLFEPN